MGDKIRELTAKEWKSKGTETRKEMQTEGITKGGNSKGKERKREGTSDDTKGRKHKGDER